jgi:AcrR family transcriptional regulator
MIVGVPKLWDETVETHRRTVQEAIQDTTARLAFEQGLSTVTMSQIATETGIGRATLYKYYSDVESILLSWHERQISQHLRHLAQIRDQPGDAVDRLTAVLEAFAEISHQRHGTELSALLHSGDHLTHAQQHLHDFITGLIAQGAAEGAVRGDIAPGELATYCLHALTAASALPAGAALHRLVELTLTALHANPTGER